MEVILQANKFELTQALFVAKVHLRELQNNDFEGQVETAVLYHDLIQLVMGRDAGNSDNLMQKINQNILLRKQYRDLIKRLNFASSPRYAAAASKQTDLITRETADFSLKFKRDSVEPRQIFAVLQIKYPTETHITEGVILHTLSSSHFARFEFKPLIDGRAQILFDESDPQLQFLLDADAEISIMP